MPPTHTDEGLRAAAEIRNRFPDTGVLVLSQYVEAGYAMELFARSRAASAISSRIAWPTSMIRRLPCGVSPKAARCSTRRSWPSCSAAAERRSARALTPREREVLELMAEGRSNQAIAERLFVTPRAVEKHVTSIFAKLGLPATTEDHRRVLAVRAFLQS